MSRLLYAVFILMFVASCGGGAKAPKNLDNACSIVKQRPKVYRAMKKTKRKWGVPVHVQMAIIHQESKFVKNARTPVKYVMGVLPMGRQSSAFGYAQALDGTWKEYQRAEGGRSAKRTNIRHATDFMGWYMTETKRVTGLSLSDARGQYLAYHDGRTGYLRGSYKRKAWLVNVANKVGERSAMYQQQLARCRK